VFVLGKSTDFQSVYHFAVNNHQCVKL